MPGPVRSLAGAAMALTRQPGAFGKIRSWLENSSTQVVGPISPSATNPRLLWNAVTARVVNGANSPSTSNPASATVFNRSWIIVTCRPVAPCATAQPG